MKRLSLFIAALATGSCGSDVPERLPDVASAEEPARDSGSPDVAQPDVAVDAPPDMGPPDVRPDVAPDLEPDMPPPPCPNGFCGPGEDRCNCPEDCFSPCCGDLLCEGFESPCNCPGDCPGFCCGNGPAVPCETALGEDSCNCEYDCPGNCCGDGTCESPPEDNGSCPDDCPDTCPNGVCDPGENCFTCPADCAAAGCCGNGVCDAGEDDTNCAADCGCSAVPSCVTGVAPAGCACDICCTDRGTCCADAILACNLPLTACGNAACDCDETDQTCIADCSCGDDSCDLTIGENDVNCPPDCGCGSIASVCGGIGGSTYCYCDNCCTVFGDCCSDAVEQCAVANPCGNGICEHSKPQEEPGDGGVIIYCESTTSCPGDCFCGNDSCDYEEDDVTCEGDCYCGNGTCDDHTGESALDCPEDCGG